MAKPDKRPVTLEELLASSLAQSDALAKLLRLTLLFHEPPQLFELATFRSQAFNLFLHFHVLSSCELSRQHLWLRFAVLWVAVVLIGFVEGYVLLPFGLVAFLAAVFLTVFVIWRVAPKWLC
jgi:hypothetical protein